jgi:signal transduction histidine kinase
MMHVFDGLGHFRALQVAIPLPDGPWLHFATSLPESGPDLSSQFLLSIALMGIIIVAVSTWAVRSMTAPLASLSAAAERFGTDLNADPMPETGTIETQRAAHAFNTMQKRLRGLVENRTRLLAAISHDLRTPLTLLRLRAENVGEAEEREKMLATISDMESMIAATLQFSRDDAQVEARRRTDVTALLASIVDDMADAGRAVSMEPAQALIAACQPGALKRALTNLLDNAVTYGRQAHVAIRSATEGIVIMIDDTGPGIPDDELERVFQPFYRLESSRSRDTGGIGLGLAIALATIQAHGGDIVLANRPEGGLRVTVSLPR